MAKPSIKTILPIDGNIGGTISATYSGDLPYSNKIIIYNASDLSIVYQNTESTHNLYHSIPRGVLVNGQRYAATIQFFDQKGVASSVSDKSFFLALATPSFRFEGITGDTTINNSEIVLNIQYNQANAEPLYNYQFMLYTAEKNVISSSDIMYDVEKPSYSFKSLENRNTYYVRAKGTTTHGIVCDTGMIKIFVDYQNPQSYSRIYADSDINGVVNGYTHITLIDPVDPDITHYTFSGGFIDLRNKEIEYNNSYNLKDNFVLCIKAKAFNLGKEMLVMKNTEYENITLTPIAYENQIIFKLSVFNGICNYILYSNKFNYNASLEYVIWIKRVNDVYKLNVLTN